MPLLTNTPTLNSLKESQSNSYKDCLLHHDGSKYVFIGGGTNCEEPTNPSEIGGGVTLGAVRRMFLDYEYLTGEDRTICVDYGRKLFDALLYNEDGTPSDVQAIRFYFGMKPNREGEPSLNLIIVPLDDKMMEPDEIKTKRNEQRCADDVGHGTDSSSLKENPKLLDKFLTYKITH